MLIVLVTHRAVSRRAVSLIKFILTCRTATVTSSQSCMHVVIEYGLLCLHDLCSVSTVQDLHCDLLSCFDTWMFA